MSGIRVEFKVSGEGCPVVEESTRSDAPVREVNRTSLGTNDTVVEEVVFDDVVDDLDESFEKLFTTEEASIYRFNRVPDSACVCDQIEETLEHPISNIRIQNRSLYVTMHIDDIEALQSVIAKLRDEFQNVSVCEIAHSDIRETADTMTFDREQLTERQREVYRTAYEMGYFEHTKRANASEIADELDIAVSTFIEHLSIVQAKLGDAFFNGGDYY